MKQPLIILTGPTAVGKTALSIELAKRIGGEIISADSMQIYKHMDIGSAKVTAEEMDGVRHHLIDVLEPDEEFNVTVFQRLAKEALSEIYNRNKIPVIAGGTGFYIQALLKDIDFAENEGGTGIREELEKLADENGADYMHGMLAEIDREAAEQIHANNIKRVIRAIEYFRQTGEKISVHNERESKKEPPYDFRYFVLNTDRKLLYERIDKRIDKMLETGLVDEVAALKKMGCNRSMTSMHGLGYKEILDYLDGKITLDEAVYILKRDTRHFAKRQITWFKRECGVEWFYLPDYGNSIERVLEDMVMRISERPGYQREEYND